MNVIILAAGIQDTLDTKYPTYLTEVNSKPFIEYQINFLKPLEPKKILMPVVKMPDISIDPSNILKKISNIIEVIEIPKPTSGGLMSALMCSDHINLNEELIVMNCNEYVNTDISEFVKFGRSKKVDATIALFDSLHPRYANAKIISSKKIIEITFNHSNKNMACSGLIWFKYSKNFIKNSCEFLEKMNFFEKPVYFQNVLNQMILNNFVVNGFEIKNEQYLPLKNVQDLLLITEKLKEVKV